MTLVILFLTSYIAAGQALADEAHDRASHSGNSERIRSKAYAESREILIDLPSGYQSGSGTRYPVVYVLDAGNEFSHTAASIRYLAENANSIPNLILVGVLHTNRGDEMRPTFPATGEPNKLEGVFRQYILGDVVPYIDAHYDTHPYRILIGHSLGGLFVLNTLQTRPESFNAYLASSPALWWQEGLPLEQMATFMNDANLSGRNLLVTTGDEGNESQAEFLELSTLLEDNAATKLTSRTKAFVDYGHDEVAPASTYWALTQLFDGWVPSTESYRRGLPGLVEHHSELSARFGWNIPIPAETLLGLTFEFARRGNPGDQSAVANLIEYTLDQDPCLLSDIVEISDALENQGHASAAELVRATLGDQALTALDCDTDKAK